MRLFVALDVPAAVRQALPEPAAPWRPVPRENLHLTLAFLGSLPDPAPVAAAVAGAVGPAGMLRATGAVALPPRRPRVLAVVCEDRSGACGRLQASVAAALVAAGLYTPEARPWLAHITVGRTRERVGREVPLVAVEPLEFRPPSVSVYASRPGPGGSRYEALARFALAD